MKEKRLIEKLGILEDYVSAVSPDAREKISMSAKKGSYGRFPHLNFSTIQR